MLNKIKKVKYWLVCAMIVFVAVAETATAQEFNCDVTLNTRQISGSAYEYVTELEQKLEAYINENRWTDDRYQEHERIRCQLQIVLTGVDEQFNYTAEAFFSVRRPIYNTIQETVSIVLSDNNWRFGYPRNKNLIFDELQFDDLTSFIDFYMYVILGYDYDSFSRLGGSRYYSQAQDIFDLGRNSNAQGWGRSIGSQRNRYGLISDIRNPNYQPLREAIYRYHRWGLDLFTINNRRSIEEVVGVVKILEEAKRRTSNNYLFDIFFDTKYNEIVAVLQSANVETRLEAYNMLRDVDPAHSTAYERLQN